MKVGGAVSVRMFASLVTSTFFCLLTRRCFPPQDTVALLFSIVRLSLLMLLLLLSAPLSHQSSPLCPYPLLPGPIVGDKKRWRSVFIMLLLMPPPTTIGLSRQ